ncbi:hypothetical protein LWI29_007072 [Acer saccharum]|uniref:Integrase zinc-binding domain-containing protein n=1 Tax=Acer saccharum TaxID=4024 RepID=A0AA39T346_ACESA|nr:hypothetical protein LWI29_007072 [Acer saccharum]
MTVVVPGFETFRDLLKIDPYFAAIMLNLSAAENKDFLVVDGFLFRGNQLCVPDNSLRFQIIKELHGEGHVGRDRTLQLVKDDYFRLIIQREVERYVLQWKLPVTISATFHAILKLSSVVSDNDPDNRGIFRHHF